MKNGEEQETKRIVKAVVSQYLNSTEYEFQDLYTEGIIEAIKARQEYLEDKNTKKTTYIYMRVKYKILNLIRAELAQKRKPKKKISYESLKLEEHQEYFYLGLEKQKNQEEELLKKEEKEEFQKVLKEILKPDEIKYINLYLEGKSVAQIAKMYMLDYKKVANKIYYIKKKIKKKQYKFDNYQKIL